MGSLRNSTLFDTKTNKHIHSRAWYTCLAIFRQAFENQSFEGYEVIVSLRVTERDIRSMYQYALAY